MPPCRYSVRRSPAQVMYFTGAAMLRANGPICLRRLGLQPAPRLEDPPHRRQAHGQKEDSHGKAHAYPDVGEPVETPAEAADQVDDRVEEGGLLPERRQHANRVEAAAEEDQGRDDEQRHDLQLLDVVGPDPDNEAEEAEGNRREHEERDHPQRMIYPDRHEESRGGQDDHPDHHGLGRCGPNVAYDDLDVGDGRGENLIDSPRELGEEDAERRVRDALRQQGQHDQARHDKRTVADALYAGDARAYRRAEDDEIERGRDDGRDDALQQRAKSPRHLERVNRAYGMKVHRFSLTRSTKISSRELCFVWRSSNVTPALSRSARRSAMSIRPACESYV